MKNMNYKILYVEDLNPETKIAEFKQCGYTIDVLKPLSLEDTIDKIINGSYDALVFDYKLTANREKSANKLYNAPTLAQTIRTMGIPTPIILLSSQKIITEAFDLDYTSQDLVECCVSKEMFTKHILKNCERISAFIEAYKKIDIHSYKLQSALSVESSVYKNIDYRLKEVFDQPQIKNSTYAFCRFIHYEVIRSIGVLVGEDVLSSRLGVSKESQDWDKLLEKVDEYKYKGILSEVYDRWLAGYVYSSCGFGESTTDLVFAGNGLIYENGSELAHNDRFSFEAQIVISEIDVARLRSERRQNTTFAVNKGNNPAKAPIRIATKPVYDAPFTLTRNFDMHPFVPKGRALDERCEEIFSIQVSGLAQRLVHTHAQTAVVGISGGLDSTLALLVCVKTFDKLNIPRERIVGITMPGFGTTDRTYNNAIDLLKSLGVTICEISIKESVIQHFKDIDHDINVHDIHYENSQAREHTHILMDIANQTNDLVFGNVDVSE